LARLSLGALGVVFGDIGTSPLYTLKECFSDERVAATDASVLGVLSLIFWSLSLIVVVKYLGFVMRADNHGEGGILALLSLLTDPQGNNPKQPGEPGRRRRLTLIVLGIFGAALLFADGLITPVISVLGALEGLEVSFPTLDGWEVPLALVILVSLFVAQRYGTASIGRVFGPTMLVWFGSIAACGLPWIVREPRVLLALSPVHAYRFFANNGFGGFLLLGAVVLCVTGAEALYADMGHFGEKPIRLAWGLVAFPALLINYFGQGALLLGSAGGHIGNPFFEMAPELFRIPLLVIATAAAIIASQALISGAFSLAQQSVQLGLCPRLRIIHTSESARGQIYVPAINAFLLVGCVSLVIIFRSTSNLAAAYGIAVMATMVITTFLYASVARQQWRWPRLPVAALVALFLAVELPYLIANLAKVVSGGWFPLMVAAAVFVLLTTWKTGRRLLAERLDTDQLPIASFLASLEEHPLTRVPGIAVFMTSKAGGTPIVLLHHVKHNRVLHERIVLLTVETVSRPYVRAADRVTVSDLGAGFWEVVARFGFMESPDVPLALRAARPFGLEIDPKSASYYLGRETLLLGRRRGLSRWRKAIFIFLSRNARTAGSFFGLPANRVIELGAQVEL